MTEQAAPAALPSRSRKKAYLVTAMILVLPAVMGWYGLDWYRTGRFEEETNDAYVGADVTVISPRVPGLIAQVAVTDNQEVHAGDVLIRLDDREYRASLAFAEASIAAQQAAIGDIDAKRNLQENMITQAEAELKGADAEQLRAQRDQKRNTDLAHTDAVSGQTLDHVAADLQKADAAESRAKAALAAAESELKVLDAQKIGAEAAMKQASAQRDLAKLNLEYTELRAPVDGVVGNRSAKAGAFAAAGTALISIVPSHGLWIDANFKEGQLEHMQPGQVAHIVADAAPGHDITGHIESIAPATGAQFSILPPENATGNFTKIVQRVPVRIALDDKDGALGQLRPGLSVSVIIDRRPANDAADAGASHEELSRR